MNLVRAILTSLGLMLLSWISILFVFAAGNIFVVVFAFMDIDFGWVVILALVLNVMSGALIVGIWIGESKGLRDSIAQLAGFVLAFVCLGSLIFITGENSILNIFYKNYVAHQVKIIMSIPALTVLGCFFLGVYSDVYHRTNKKYGTDVKPEVTDSH